MTSSLSSPRRGLFLLACLLSCHFLFAGPIHGAEPGEVVFDFESGNLQGWTLVEGKFDKFVCDRANFHHGNTPYNKQGTFFLSSLERADTKPDDSFTGVAESPVFELQDERMTLLVGGGQHVNTYVALCTLDEKEVLKACGHNEQKMHRIEWKAPELVGKKVFLRLVDRNTGGWGHITFDDFHAKGDVDKAASIQRIADRPFRVALAGLNRRIEALNVEGLRAAVQDLSENFPKRYSKGQLFLDVLSGFEARAASIRSALERREVSATASAEAYVSDVEAFRAEALIANPLVSEQPILYVVRHQYKPDHHNTATIFQTGEINTGSFVGGGAIKTIDFGNEKKTTTLWESTESLARDPEVHFDGEKLIFSMRRNIEDDYHLYEMNTDGSGLRQLTSAKGVADFDPLYLPDGQVVFSSTREPKFCMCNRHIMGNLFRMDADGANIHQIGKSTLFEGHGALMPDGRVLYYRWEYVDRNFGDAQGLWTVNPDGTNHAVYWGNNTWSPGGVIDAKPIPGTQQIVAILGSCHDRPWGAVAIIDRQQGIDNRTPVVRTWPSSAIDLVKAGDPKMPGSYGFDVFKQVNPKYEDPYPLSEKYFLCSRTTGHGEEMGLYLIDVFGNELLLHTEGGGCFDPMPLAPHPRPQAIPERRDFENKDGFFYVADVYEGTHMKGVERGTVKYLRVVESPEKRFWTHTNWSGQGVHCPAMNWHDFANKRILGTVPVEEDGSAYFAAPADTFVYFQLLDKDGMMVQSMRSGVIVQSGERLGCAGCHENRRTAPRPGKREMPMAVRRAPSKLAGWYGEPRVFNYMTEVQPVLDKYCVRCHDYGKKAGEKLNLCGDRTTTFNTSYNELWRKKAIGPIGAGPAAVQKAYSWGSHASTIIGKIRKGHGKVEMAPEDFDRLVTWIDINAPYYPRYASAYPENLAGRSPLNGEQTKRLSELTGVNFNALAGFSKNQGPKLSFDRPVLSRCLAKLDKESAQYAEALSIIQSGGKMLRERPRADMAGFEPCPTDAQRQRKYAYREEEEDRNRAAIRLGRKAYDPTK